MCPVFEVKIGNMFFTVLIFIKMGKNEKPEAYFIVNLRVKKL
jgi:hypothetical protein